MKCLNCNHVSDPALLKCSACGEVYAQAALETLQHQEYLLAWLDERAETLGPEAHARLREEALNQLDAMRGTLGLAPPPEEIASDLALVEATLQRLQGWVEATQISPTAANTLREYLVEWTGALKDDLAGRPIEVEPPSDLQLLDVVCDSLPQWAEGLHLPSTDAASLQRHLDRERTVLVQAIAHKLALVEATLQQFQGWVEAARISPISANALREHLVEWAGDLKEELAGWPVEVEPPSALQVFDFVLESLPLWAKELHLLSGQVALLRQHLDRERTTLLEPAPPPAPGPEAVRPPAPPAPAPVTPPAPKPTPATPGIAPPAPPPKPIPKPPPEPKRPLINWGQAWEKAVEAFVSGALLRVLLYLGAFMIVVSAIVLVAVYWRIFPPVFQLGFIAAVPLSFYAGGFVLRTWLKTPVAGGVFTGIGALLVAVDFVAVYQLGGLAGRVEPNVYWLVSSVFCTVVYAVTAWRLPIEFFGYITLIGLSSALLALTRVLGWPLEWEIASVTASAVGMVAGGVRLESAPDRWRELARAARRLPQILIPVSLAVILFVPGPAAFGQMGAFVLASMGYGMLAWRFPATIFAHASVWSSIGAAGFALRAIEQPEWLATAAAILVPLYILAGRWLERHWGENFAPRVESRDAAPRRGYVVATNLAGFGLLVIAVFAGFIVLLVNLWAGVLALTLAALVLAWCAYLFRRPILVPVASGLFIVPFSLSIARWLNDFNVPQWGAWLIAAWAGLAFVYLGLAVLLRVADKYGVWLNIWAHLLVPFASIGLLINYSVTAGDWFTGPTLAALGGIILVYLVSAVIHDSDRHPALSNYVAWLPDGGRAIFLWPVGFLLPVWLIVAWSGSALDRPLGAALAGLALAYVGLGQLLARRKVEYRLPPHVYAYALAVISIIVALPQTWALLTTLYIAVVVFAALAFVYRRWLETALAALLFIWPFQLSLGLSGLTPHAHSLAYVLLASLGYIPLGLALDNKAGRTCTLPVYVIGYALSAYALGASLLGRFDLYPLDLPGVAVATPLVVTGLQVFSWVCSPGPPAGSAGPSPGGRGRWLSRPGARSPSSSPSSWAACCPSWPICSLPRWNFWPIPLASSLPIAARVSWSDFSSRR